MVKRIAVVVLMVVAVAMLWRSWPEPPQQQPAVDVKEAQIAIRIACAYQEEIWCSMKLPPGASREQIRVCATDYFPKCSSCLKAVDRSYRASERYRLPDECQPLKGWLEHP
jgi:hypothetical protein